MKKPDNKLIPDKKLLMRQALLVLLDVFNIVLAGFLALFLRFEMNVFLIPPEFVKVMAIFGVPFVIMTVLFFHLFRIYRSLWEYASVIEGRLIIGATFMSALVQLLVVDLSGNRLPRSYYPGFWSLSTILVAGSRLFYRYMRIHRKNQVNRGVKKRNLMIVGAGEAGRSLINEIENSEYLNQKVCCVIDDDPAKKGRYIRGIYIFGGRESIIEAAAHYEIDEIIVAIPSATMKDIRPILQICKETSCELRILPGMYQMVNGEVSVSKLRSVKIEDLLGREEIRVNLDEIMGYVSNKVVLVTGGGGSIGSELCRQIAGHHPKQLIILDIYENNAYEIQQELLRTHPELNLVTLIGSVRDEGRLESLFKSYRPEIVYHAAAHKHVPLMEVSPNEAIKNNVLGTLKLAQAADRWKVKRFVQISTDKAVNPTNVMGATKRICEMIIQTINKNSETEFVAVRFGNVLGSNGSVIPLFRRQIEEGGPVTVTHPDIIRYFMTIPEAVSLVLQAGAYAKGGEIFVLDMGEPVRILDLARNMIRLSGLREGRDIEIEFTGLRPGEKLYEEMLMDEEGLEDTPNHLIHIGKPIEVDEEQLYRYMEMFDEAVNRETHDIRVLIKELVPTYHPKN